VIHAAYKSSKVPSHRTTATANASSIQRMLEACRRPTEAPVNHQTAAMSTSDAQPRTRCISKIPFSSPSSSHCQASKPSARRTAASSAQQKLQYATSGMSALLNK